MKRLGSEHLDDLSLGAVFLATGGGGDPYVSLLLAREVLEQHGPVTLQPVNAIADDAFVATLGGVGAPSVGLELLPSAHDAQRALDQFERELGRTLDALVAFEVGGGNSLMPIMAAAERGLPVVDGDGMGRALPEAQMMTFPIAGISPTPSVAVDYAGNSAVLRTQATLTYERHIRGLAQAMGGMITTAEHPMSGADLKSAIIPGTISFAVELGRLLREQRGPVSGVLPALQALFAGSIYGDVVHLFRGKVVGCASQVIGGYDVGTATIEPLSGQGETLTLAIKNEYLLATIGDRVVASVPDLIVALDDETSTPINAERMRFGQRVSVVAVGCPAFFRQPAALAVVAPRCFGFDVDYVPLEQLTTRLYGGRTDFRL